MDAKASERVIEMTSLGGKEVYRGNGYVVYLSVSGDLSHSYRVAPVTNPNSVGYAFGNKKDAIRFIRVLKRYGYDTDRTNKIYDKQRDKIDFGYLSYREAKPYLKYAYGDVAEKYKRRVRR